MKLAAITALLTTLSLAAGFGEVDIKQFEQLRAKGVPVIDIRTPQEWKQTGIIKGSHMMMFFDERGQAHAQKWMSDLKKITTDKNTPLIIYCAHANRTKVLGKWLTDEMGYKNVYELEGGIAYGWIDKGQTTVKAQ
ncbi:MAG TPA: rhodanese-like domain-containing protein [Sulfurovum sp.]|nr:rhodanese-like domain-containing protein [Sulfurovum sp.]